MGLRKLLNVVAPLFFLYSVNAQDVKINEMVVDPKQDHNGDGKITDSDEYFELFNASETESYNLENWTLNLYDTTPEIVTLKKNIILPKGTVLIMNPLGSQNNSGQITLFDNYGNQIDSITYGSWAGATIPSGNSSGLFDESLSRDPDGSTNWKKTIATPGQTNSSPKDLEAKLLIENLSSTNNVRIYTKSPLNTNWVLQCSSDLTNWNSVYTNNSYTLLSFEGSKTNSACFYKLSEKKN